MLELDEATRRTLSQRYGPTPAAKARVLGQLRAEFGGGGPDGSAETDSGSGSGESPPVDGTPPTGTEQLAWAAKVVGATVGLTGAGLLVLKLGASVLGGVDGERPPSHGQVEAATPSATGPEALDPATRGVQEGDETVEPAESVVEAEPPLRASSPRRRVPATPGLAAELALIDGAERARRSDPQTALAQLDEHARRFPAGSLAPEREVLRVEILCALGRHAEAERSGAIFLKASDAPQLRARIEASCAGTGSGSAGD